MTLQVLELGMNIRAADDMSVMLRNHGRHYVLECGQSHIRHLLNIKICLKPCKRNFHSLQVWKRNEVDFRFS
ncbi:hypothetical protein CsSME_00012878 [Camellia sinensis var. sinensis]